MWKGAAVVHFRHAGASLNSLDADQAEALAILYAIAPAPWGSVYFPCFVSVVSSLSGLRIRDRFVYYLCEAFGFRSTHNGG